MYRHIEGQGRKLTAWYTKHYTAWGAAMKGRVRQMKQHPPLSDRHGKSPKQYYPKTYNPLLFQPVNNKGNYECTFLYRKSPKAPIKRIPITWKFFKTSRTKLESLLKYSPELKAIIYALDDACVPLRRLDRLLRERRHVDMKINKLLRQHNGSSMLAGSSRTEQSHKPGSIVELQSDGEAAFQPPAPMGERRERRLSRQREF